MLLILIFERRAVGWEERKEILSLRGWGKRAAPKQVCLVMSPVLHNWCVINEWMCVKLLAPNTARCTHSLKATCNYLHTETARPGVHYVQWTFPPNSPEKTQKCNHVFLEIPPTSGFCRWVPPSFFSYISVQSVSPTFALYSSSEGAL